MMRRLQALMTLGKGACVYLLRSQSRMLSRDSLPHGVLSMSVRLSVIISFSKQTCQLLSRPPSMDNALMVPAPKAPKMFAYGSTTRCLRYEVRSDHWTIRTGKLAFTKRVSHAVWEVI